MKVFVFALLALAATASAAPRGDTDIADIIQLVFDTIKKAIPEDAELKLTDKELTLPENDYENGKITVNEISLSGLKSIYYSVTQDTDTHLDYSVDIDDLVAVFDLNLDLTGLLTASDRVYVSIDLQTLQLAGDLSLNEDYSEVSEIDALISLKGADIKVEGVVSDEYSEQLSTELSEKVPEVVNKIATALEEQVSGIVKYVINWVLKALN